MWNKNIAAVICAIYCVLIVFYIHSISSSKTTQFDEFSREKLVYYCCEENTDCGYQIVNVDNPLLANFSDVIPEVVGTFNVQYFDDFRCAMKEVAMDEISYWRHVRTIQSYGN
jgi:hypothetical protein